MTSLSWLIGIGLLVLLTIQAVNFHRATVCRQEAWLKSIELKTRGLHTDSAGSERVWHPTCQFIVVRSGDVVTWRKKNSMGTNSFQLDLEGKL